MKRSTRHRLLLLLVVLALLGLAGWQLQRDASHDTGNLTGIDPAAINQIPLSLPGAPTLPYEKRAGHWGRPTGPPTRPHDARPNALPSTPAAHGQSWPRPPKADERRWGRRGEQTGRTP